MRGADEHLAKGYVFLSYVTPLRREKSALWAKLEQRLPEDSRAFFATTIFANDWHPRRHFHSLMRAYGEAVGSDKRELRELGAMGARYQVHVIYRLFLKFATPAMVFRRASSVWSRQSTVGRFDVVEEGDDFLIGELFDPDPPDGLLEIMSGWSDTIISMLGRTPYPTTHEPVGPNRWRFRVSWVRR